MKRYLAYGSNLSQEQMSRRCPMARVIGKAQIPNHELVFKGSLTGSYATIEPKEGSYVPVLVWEIHQSDERNLDVYEGFPTFYHKNLYTVDIQNMSGKELGTYTCMAYVMDESRPYGVPTSRYFEVIATNYLTYGFDLNILEEALDKSLSLVERGELSDNK